MVWSKKSLLTNKAYAINEEFPREIAYRRRKLFPRRARKLHRVNKKTVTLKSEMLTIGVKCYSVDTLNQLKGPLDMKMFNERSNVVSVLCLAGCSVISTHFQTIILVQSHLESRSITV